MSVAAPEAASHTRGAPEAASHTRGASGGPASDMVLCHLVAWHVWGSETALLLILCLENPNWVYVNPNWVYVNPNWVLNPKWVYVNPNWVLNPKWVYVNPNWVYK
jgi:hypothetical protein